MKSMCVLALAVANKLMQPNCTEGCGNVVINVHTSSAPGPNKGGACKTCGSFGNMEQVSRVVLTLLATWSSTNVWYR